MISPSVFMLCDAPPQHRSCSRSYLTATQNVDAPVHIYRAYLPVTVATSRCFSFFSSSETVFALSSGHGKCGKLHGQATVFSRDPYIT